MKTLLITISTITLLLFTSCEDEMGRGGTGGGGMQDAVSMERSASVSIEKDNETILVSDTILKVDE